MKNNTEYLRDNLPKKIGRTLIVGSHVYPGRDDRRKAYKDSIGLDMIPGEGVDCICNIEYELPNIGKFNHIECCSVFEHSKKPWLMAEKLEYILNINGTIFISAPFAWRVHSYPNDYFRFTISGIKSLFSKIEWTFDTMTHFKENVDNCVPIIKVDQFPYIARSESICFGYKK